MKKILFIGDEKSPHYQYAIIMGLKSNGFKVIAPKLMEYQEPNRIIKWIYRKTHKQNFIRKQNEQYIKFLIEEKPDIVFIINDCFIEKKFLAFCQETKVKVWGYCLDSIKWCNEAMQGNNIYAHLPYYDALYSYEPTDVCLRTKNNKPVKYLPLGFDSRYYDQSLSSTRHYEYDVCFVGGLDKRRLEFLDTVAKYVKENGYRMLVITNIQLKRIASPILLPKIISRRIRLKYKYKYLYPYISNDPVNAKELADIYSKTKICLNIHQGVNPEDHTGPNPRTFETMASGAMQIIDKGHIGVTDLIGGGRLNRIFQ